LFFFNFSCSKCDFNTKSEAEYVCHLKENHEVLHQDDKDAGVKKIPQDQVRLDRLYKCKHCKFHVSENKEQFWQHAEKHMDPEKVKRCPICPFVTEFKHHLLYHMRNHLGQKPFKCPFCIYKCVNKAMLSSHLKYSHGKKLVDGVIQEEDESGTEITKQLRLFRKERAKKPKLRIRTTSEFNGGGLDADKTSKISIALEPRISDNLDNNSVENISEKSTEVSYYVTAIDNVLTKVVPIEKDISILSPENPKAQVFKVTEENLVEDMVDNSETQISVDKFFGSQHEKPVNHSKTEPDIELFEVTDDSVTQISVDKFFGNQPEKTTKNSKTVGPEVPKTCKIKIPKPVPQGNFKCSLCKDTFKSVQEKLTHLDLAHRSHKCTDCTETFNSKQECTLHIKSNHEILPQEDINGGAKKIPKNQVRVWKCKHCKLQVARDQEHFGLHAEKNMNQNVKRCPKCPLSMMRLELIEETVDLDIEPSIENNAENSKEKPTNSLQLSNNQEETFEEIHDKPLIEIEVTSETASLTSTEKADETPINPFTISSEISTEKFSRNSAEDDLIDEMPEKLPKTLRGKNLNEQHNQVDVEILSVNGVNDQIDSDSEVESSKESQISVEIPADYEKVLSNLKSEVTYHPIAIVDSPLQEQFKESSGKAKSVGKTGRPRQSPQNLTEKNGESGTDNETCYNQSPTRKRGRPRKSLQKSIEKLDGESKIEDVIISRRVYNFKCSPCNIAFKLKKDFEQHNVLHGSVLHHDKSDGRSDIKDQNHEDQSPSRKRGRPKKNPEKFGDNIDNKSDRKSDNEDQNHEDDQSTTPRKRVHPKTYQFKIDEIKKKELIIDMVNNKSDRKSDIGGQSNGDHSPARRRGRSENKPVKSDKKRQKELDITMVYDKTDRKSDIGEQSHEDQSPSRKRGRPKKNSEKTNESNQKELKIDRDMVQKLEILAGKLNKTYRLNNSSEKSDEKCDKNSTEDNEEISTPVSKTDESNSPRKRGRPKKNPDAIIEQSEMSLNIDKEEKEASDDSELPRKRGRPKKNPKICIKQSEINPTLIGKEESKKATRTTDQQNTEQAAGFLVEDEMLLDE
jgi:hypothetical protein